MGLLILIHISSVYWLIFILWIVCSYLLTTPAYFILKKFKVTEKLRIIQQAPIYSLLESVTNILPHLLPLLPTSLSYLYFSLSLYIRTQKYTHVFYESFEYKISWHISIYFLRTGAVYITKIPLSESRNLSHTIILSNIQSIERILHLFHRYLYSSPLPPTYTV